MEPKEFLEDMNWGKELEEWKMRLEVLGVIRNV